jgi:Zn-dependent peptidase ImmA (M78 family)
MISIGRFGQPSTALSTHKSFDPATTMALDLRTELPRRLRVQREALYTLDELAARTSFSVDALEAFETGGRLPYLHELNELSWALGVDPMVMLSEAGPESDPCRSAARFRSQEGARLHADDRRLLSVASELGRVGGFLWSLVRGDDLPIKVGSTPLKRGTQPWKQGYELGESSRKDLLPSSGPILHLQRALEDLGIHVAWAKFTDPSIDAASLAEDEALPVIVVNARSARLSTAPAHAQNVLRSILAHELCHILHDGNRKRNPLTMVTVAHGQESLDSDKERRANAFAPSFLAPASLLDLSSGYQDVAVELVARWYFTPQGAANHVKNLYGLTPSSRSSLERELRQAPGAIQLSQESLPPARPLMAHGLIERLAREACKAELITQGRLSEIMRMA